MATKKTSEGNGRKRSRLRKILGLIAFGLMISALDKELERPAAERTWNGKVLDVVPTPSGSYC